MLGKMASSSLFVPDEKLFFQHESLLDDSNPMLMSNWVIPSSSTELPAQLPEDEGKLTVVLDIDETLVHAETKFTQADFSRDTFVITVNNTNLLIRKRPFLDDFLKEAADKFELIAYTAGSAEYANLVLDNLDPSGRIFRHRLYRQHCLYKCGESFVKDLRVVNRSLQRTVLVDNNAHSFLMQLENGIPIASFINDIADKALVTLFNFLKLLDPEQDVRHALTRIFRLEVMLGNLARTAISPVMRTRLSASAH